MTKQVLARDYGRVTYYIQDEGKFHIQTITDVEQTLDYTQVRRNANLDRAANGDHFVGRFPIAVINAWAHKRGVTFDDVMQNSKLLEECVNDPDNEAFRVHKGRL